MPGADTLGLGGLGMFNLPANGLDVTPNAVPGAWDKFKGLFADNQIFGMQPQNFAAVAGQLGSAISPANSWQKSVGDLAGKLGQAQIQAAMEKTRHDSLTATLRDLLKNRAEADVLSLSPSLLGGMTLGGSGGNALDTSLPTERR